VLFLFTHLTFDVFHWWQTSKFHWALNRVSLMRLKTSAKTFWQRARTSPQL
jgi:hypothetical protein